MGQLTLQNLSFSADGTQLLRGITFTQDNKGVNAILGPNGAGKSLLLLMMHGLIKPKSGTLSWDGKAPEKTKLSRGFVFQSPVVLRRSVRDNLAYPLKALKLNAEQQSKAIIDILHLSQLSDLADQPAASLSGGEAQRMAIARALIIQPETLLLDEPCSNLDPTSTKLIEAMILNFVENGGSVYISTHDMAQAKRIADVVMFIEAGQLLEHATAHNFFSNASTPQAQTYLSGEL